MADSIFDKIIKREIPAVIRYEDEEFIAIDDIHPHAPIHVLVIPKQSRATLEDIPLEDSSFHARLLQTARKVASLMGISSNYRLAMNVGRGVQAVEHVHLHVLGGWQDTEKAKAHKF